jgi:eukaryotic-like serine/threonine-protein kinase
MDEFGERPPALSKDSYIGPYQIVAPLGAGAMGEVYRARDPRLGREIAIKILNAEASGLADRRARFEREARAAAALNHPNILSVYDFGLDNGRFYIASELVEGESLRSRIGGGPVPVRDLYRIAVQLADGLAAAHAAGITHRDLKPENVMVNTEGRVKILDFGLARQAGTARTSAAPADTEATRTQVDTQPGTVMGTVAYMSPEQVRGLPLDHRSDQFSFGIMLYEMAAGQRPFASETSVQTMSAILTEEPKPIDAKVPAPLRWTMARCLEKDPSTRYDSTRDLYQELRSQQEHLSDVFTSAETPATLPAPVPSRSHWPKAAVAAVALSLAVAAGAVWWGLHRSPGADRYRFTPMEVSWGNPAHAVWSPDGKAFAYDAEVGGARQVFIRYLNSQTPVQLTHGTDGMSAVGWLPDGKRVVSMGDNPRGKKPGKAIFATPVFGGEPELLLTADVEYAGTSPDGKVLAVVAQESGKLYVETSSPVGAPLQRYTPAPFETSASFNSANLRVSPNGRRILLFVDDPQGRTLWNLPWPVGPPAQKVPLRLPVLGGTPFFTWLPDNRHIVLDLQDQADDLQRHLWMADVDSGSRRQITSGTSSEFAPAASPDGKTLLFQQAHSDFSLISVSLENGAARRLLSSELPAGMPAWALHQPKFAYVTHRNGRPEIWVRGDGWDQPVVTPASFSSGTTTWFMNPALSPGAERVIYTRIETSGQILTWISSLSGGPPVRLTNDLNSAEISASWAPDGKGFAYIRYRNGESDLMVVKTNGEASPSRLRAKIDSLPEWSPDGRWIKFQDREGGDGWILISPDGKAVQVLGLPDAAEMTFSRDSRLLYGIRQEQGRGHLFSFDLTSKQRKDIGDLAQEFMPSSFVNPGIRLSLAPDGKSILYPAVRSSGSLWMLKGFE